MTEIRSRRRNIEDELARQNEDHGYTIAQLARQMGVPVPDTHPYKSKVPEMFVSKLKRDNELLSYVGAYAGISLERMRQIFSNSKRLNIDKLATFILNLTATNEFKQAVVAISSEGRNIDTEGYVRNFKTKRHPPYLEPISPLEVARVVEQIIDYEEQEPYLPATVIITLLTQLVPIHQDR